MTSIQKIFFLIVAVSLLVPGVSFAKDGELGLSVVKVKAKGSWTEVMIAVENHGSKDAEFQCCKVFLENTDGYAVPSLTKQEVQTQIHNKAKTAATIGTIVGLGLGLGGAISGHEELGYAGLGVAGGSVIAGVAGESSADGKQRSLVIDDIMRNQVFPAGLKVAGVVYFPPKKKWPGSQKAQAVHLTYNQNGKSHRVTAYVPN